MIDYTRFLTRIQSRDPRLHPISPGVEDNLEIVQRRIVDVELLLSVLNLRDENMLRYAGREVLKVLVEMRTKLQEAEHELQNR